MQAYYATVMEYRVQAQNGEKELLVYQTALKFEKFLYFLRAPALVFRNEYPRTEKFRWAYLLVKAAQTVFHLVNFYFVEAGEGKRLHT